MSQPKILYRCYALDGTCLYIGRTAQPETRLRKHAESKDWWCEVDTIQLLHFHTFAQLEKAEKQEIARQTPLYNVQHNPGRAQALIDYYVAREMAADDEDDDEVDDSDWVLVEYEESDEGSVAS